MVKGSFDAVVGGLDKMGLAGDEVTQKLLGDISEMVGSAGELAAGIGNGQPVADNTGFDRLYNVRFRSIQQPGQARRTGDKETRRSG